jgi:hypothetical protein
MHGDMSALLECVGLAELWLQVQHIPLKSLLSVINTCAWSVGSADAGFVLCQQCCCESGNVRQVESRCCLGSRHWLGAVVSTGHSRSMLVAATLTVPMGLLITQTCRLYDHCNVCHTLNHDLPQAAPERHVTDLAPASHCSPQSCH